MVIKIEDLENGRDFWLWARKNLDSRSKEDWPEFERIDRYNGGCPLCDFAIDCGTCPLNIKYNANCGSSKSPYRIWIDGNAKELRLEAIDQIINVYDDEIEKMKSLLKPSDTTF